MGRRGGAKRKIISPAFHLQMRESLKWRCIVKSANLGNGFQGNCGASLRGEMGTENVRVGQHTSIAEQRRLKEWSCHTKGLFMDSMQLQISKFIESLTSRICCSKLIFLLVLNILIWDSLPTSSATIYGQSTCETFGWNAFPIWKYRALPRFVPALHMDPHLQQEFLELFKGGRNHHHHYDSSSEEDSSSASFEHYVDDVELDIPTLQHIADMCPKNAFFYSLSPKHLEATIVLQRMFVAQPTPFELLKLAKALRYNRYVNPKVWYLALVGASEERPDMTGFKLAHPLDAMPDLFIPGPMLFDVMDKYRSAIKLRDSLARNGTVAAITSIIHRSRRDAPVKSTPPRRKKIVGRKGKVMQVNGNETVVDIFSRFLANQISETVSQNKKVSKSSLKNKKKFKKRKNKDQKGRKDFVSDFGGNVTEFTADSGMWKRGRFDAFEDCLVVDGSIGVRNGIENKLWYFREDMMVSQHHFYWHQEYPLNATRHRPRRAELFFYMHRNLIARYNAERLSNGMPRVSKFDIRPGAVIKSAYDSQLADVNSGKFWTPRPTGVELNDIMHQDDPDFERNIFIDVYNQLYGRLMRSVEVGHLLVGAIKTLSIRNTKGIEPLGNTVEASELNVNPAFYDAMGFHNLGHQIIGLATDASYKHKLPSGVMADTATTMRDPAFYTYHTVVDDIFDRYKTSLPPYLPRGGEYPLRWDGVEILEVEVVSKNGGHHNELRTFWSSRRFPLAPGVDGSIHKGDLDVDVCAVHLNHEPFDFKITVTLDPCAKTKTNKGTVRIFLAPRYDEHGHRLSLREQRRMMIHMDSFPADLRVGQNVIFRRSYDSNVVIPWTKTIKDYENEPKHSHAAHDCGCGWPSHLYIPKGSKEGTAFDLFVMITNFDHDYVEDNPKDLSIPEPCYSPYMFCGVKGRKYPDAKPMGYPFDRLPFAVPIKCPRGVGPIWPFLLCKFLQFFWYRPVSSLEEYVAHAPNMAATVVEIRHFDHLVW